MHRVIECLPALRRHHPRIQYLIVGGASPEGDWGEKLRRQVDDLGLTDVVRFLGQVPPERLKVPLSASDVFVLATRNEGWANVFLEAMACGLPVVTTLVGGNAEVVNLPELGILVPYGDRKSLHDALCEALTRGWDTDRIVGYARNNSWDTRIPALIEEFCRIHRQRLTAKRRRAVGDLKA
jgi:glycosyltransferase involved in cell wall biosynthesis